MSPLDGVTSSSSNPLQTDENPFGVCGAVEPAAVAHDHNVVTAFGADEKSPQQCLAENAEPNATDIPAYLLQCGGASLVTDGVAEWPTTRKLGVAIERAIEHLPAEAAAKLQSLLSPESLATMEVVSVAWLVSHATGAGEAIDGFVVAAGLVSMGAEAIDVGEDLYAFAGGALGAKSDEDLTVAGQHLARAVAAVGVDVGAALLVHKAGSSVKDLPKGGGGGLTTAGVVVSAERAAVSTAALDSIPGIATGVDLLSKGKGPDSSLSELDELSKASLKRAGKKLSPEVAAEKAKALPRIEATRQNLKARLDALLANPNISERSRANFVKLRNALQDHLDTQDLTGALRDNLEIPVRRTGSGVPFQHEKEVFEALDSLDDARASLGFEFKRSVAQGATAPEMSVMADDVAALKQQILKFLEVGP